MAPAAGITFPATKGDGGTPEWRVAFAPKTDESFNKNCALCKMPSTKQEALADLMHWLICLSRGPQSYGPLRRLTGKRHYERVLEDLYLIHKIPLSILEAEFTRNDIDFINFGVSSYVEKVGRGIDPRTAGNLIAVVECVPEHLRDEVRWYPPDWLREIASAGATQTPEANKPCVATGDRAHR